MTAKIGYKSYVGLGEEATFGTAVQPTSYIEFNSESFKKEVAEILVTAINGGRQYEKRVLGSETAGGSVAFPLVPNTILKLFKHVTGDAGTVSTLASGVYQWTFVANELSTNTSLTWQVCRDTGDTASTYNYTGSKAASVDFNVSTGDILNCSADFMCKDQVAANTIGTASFQTFSPYTFRHGTIKVADTKGAATAVAVDTWGLKIGNNLLEDGQIGSATRAVIEPGMQDVTYDVNARYEDSSFINRFLNGTKTYVSAIFDSGVTISSTYTHQITFESYNCYFNGTMPNIGSAGEILKHALPIRAIQEDPSVGSLVITVVSNLATV